MKLVIISDTHGLHDQVELPEGDVLIHCGDWSGRSTHEATVSFANWFKKQDFKHKICIAGNHDKYASWDYFASDERISYLQDSSVEIEGIKFYGMPWTPTFFDWYWMANEGTDMQKHTDKIPLDTNVLITHGPGWGTLDVTEEGKAVGSADLADRISELDSLHIHCFGHIHEGYGHADLANMYDMSNGEPPNFPVHTVNASQVDRRYRLVNKPVEIEV